MNEYVINTFVSERDVFYNKAADYYEQKTQALLNALKIANENRLENDISQVPDVEKMFMDSVTNFNNLNLTWEKIYNAGFSQQEIANAIREYNKETKKLTDSIDYQVDTLVFLEKLLGQRPDESGETSINLKELNLPQTLDLSSVKKEFSRLANQEYGTASAVGGARAKLFGEIFEQLAMAQLRANIGDLTSWLSQMGTAKSLNYSGRVTSGKSDIMFSAEVVEVVEEDKVSKIKSSAPQTIEIDAAEMIDLDDDMSLERIKQIYATGERGKIAGATVKQWLKEGSKATLAHSQVTAAFINRRDPNGAVAKGFKDRDTFNAYTAYVVARFLLNVIGVYNILMISGSHIELTYNYLRNLKQHSLFIIHMVKMKNDVYYAKNDIYIGNDSSNLM